MASRQARARSRSGPCTCVCAAVPIVIVVPRPRSARPMPPKRRPSPPFKSMKPRCSRAGTETVTLDAATEDGRLTLVTPMFFARRVFRNAYMGLDCASRRRRCGHVLRSRHLWESSSMTEQSKERTYSDEEVEARLKRELPHWYLEGGWIRRKYRTHSWKGTLMVINAVGHLAEAAWHHPDITASYAWVEVRLQNHAAKGITDKDFDLAKKIEDVVHWQPGKTGGALEGTPEKDQRFAYIKYDA